MRARLKWVAVVLVAGLAIGGCQSVRGAGAARTALEGVGYRNVGVTFRSGGGIDLVRVVADAAPGVAADDGTLQRGAAAIWSTLPFRFDRLRLTVGLADATFSYEQLATNLGPRPAGLDRRQVGDEVVMSGLKLVIVLSVGALLSVGLVLGLTLFALRKVRRRRWSARATGGEADWDGSFLDTGAGPRTDGTDEAASPPDQVSPVAGVSPTAGAASPSEGEEAMPS